MAMGAGVGAFIPAIFHLVTHAFFKGCLFLGAGSVIHGTHEEQNIQNMGGLRRYMPVTFWTFVIASFANAGLIPFAGFWSKDEIIVGSWVTNSIPVPIGKILAIVGLVTAFFTAFYMFRLVFLVFTGRAAFRHARTSIRTNRPCRWRSRWCCWPSRRRSSGSRSACRRKTAGFTPSSSRSSRRRRETTPKATWWAPSTARGT